MTYPSPKGAPSPAALPRSARWPTSAPMLAAVGTALPAHSYTQAEFARALIADWAPDGEPAERLTRFMDSVRVARRHIAAPLDEMLALDDFGAANQLFLEVGAQLGAAAITDALTRAGLAPGDVDALFFTTVTGVSAPSLDARVANRLGLRRDVRRVPMFGLGCVGGAAGVSRMADYLRAHPDHVAVLLSVELCSITFQRGDLSAANLVASGLFADGAAAVVGLGARRAARLDATGPRVLASRSALYPDTDWVMGWDVTRTGFKVILSPRVPDIVREHLAADLDAFLGTLDLPRQALTSWVCHPGGPRVLEAVQDALDLPEDALAASWRSLADLGNLSSASVLFILADTMAPPAGAPIARPDPGTLGLLLAMGPGFCAELGLLLW